MKDISRSAVSLPRLRATTSVLLALFCVATPLLAAQTYLATGQPDSISLLAPPPLPNSSEQAADLASARTVFLSATADEKERAEKYAPLTIFKFAPAIGGFFQTGKFPKTEAMLERVRASIREPVNSAKNHWKRSRPYAADPDLKFGKAEPSFSYPSGHATVGTVQALILAELFPGQRDAILEIGRGIGWDRVVIGKHFPTDIYAGRTLAQAIVRELKANADYRRDFSDAQDEVRAALTAQPSGK